MSVHESVLVIKGDRLEHHLPEIFEMFGYRDLKKDRVINNDEEREKVMSSWDLGDGRVLKAVAHSGGCVVISDPEMVMNADSNVCLAVSKRFDTRVFGMTLEGASGTYGFCVYDNGKKTREFLAIGDKLDKNIGSPLSSEIGLNLKGLAGLDEKLVTVMLGITGVDFYTLFETGSFTVKELTSVDETPGQGAMPAGSETPKKLSWRFWK